MGLLGEISSAGAEHMVRLTATGRTLFEANRPDSILLRQDGSDLYVSASFVRNATDWRVADTDAGEAAKPAAKPAPAAAPESDDLDGEPYGERSKADLVSECAARGIEHAGRATKADLVALLQASDDE